MTATIIIVGALALVVIVMLIIIYVKLSRAYKKIGILEEQNVETRIESYKTLLISIDKSLMEHAEKIKEGVEAYKLFRIDLSNYPEAMRDPDKIVDAFNTFLGLKK